MNIASHKQTWAIIGGTLLICFIAFFIFFITKGQSNQHRDKELFVHEQTKQLAKDIGLLLSDRLTLLDHIGFIYNEQFNIDQRGTTKFIERAIGSQGDIMDVAIVDNRGREIIGHSKESDESPRLKDRSQNIEFLGVKEKGYYVGPIYISEGKPLFLMGRAIFSADGKTTRAAIFALFKADALLDQLKQTGKEEGILAFIVDEKGSIVLHPTVSYVKEHKNVSSNPAVELATVQRSIGAQIYSNELTENVVGSGVPLIIPSDTHREIPTNWFVIMEIPASVVLAPLASQRKMVALGLLFSFLLMGGSLCIIVRHIRRPIIAVDQALKELNAGNVNYRLPISDQDEWKNLLSNVNNLGDTLRNLSHDVGEHRRKLDQEHHKLALVLSGISDAVVICNQKGIIMLANKAAQDLIGLDHEHLLKRHVDEALPLFEQEKPLAIYAHYIEKKENGFSRIGDINGLRFINTENHERLVSLHIGGLGVNQSIHSEGFMLVIHDMSHEHFIEKVKADFVAITAHELRTPLTEVKWSMDILMGKELGVLSRKQKNMLKRSLQSNEYMIRLVDDLLETATIESAQFRYNKSSCDIKKIISDIVEMRKKTAEQKGITLVFKKPKIHIPFVSVDEAAIKIAVNNLLENAINYTSKGGNVDVTLGKTDSALEVHIADTGIGISSEEVDRVFMKFFRGKTAVSMVTDGTGLGLYIAKKIVEAHGGTIWAQSHPDKGSVFGVSLPV